MTGKVVRRTILVAAGAVMVAWPQANQKLSPIAVNDNLTPAGELRGGVLTLQLEMRKGNWHPEAENGETIAVYAFGEAGKPLQDPGPAIRVPQGTTIDISVHSSLGVPATLHGLHQRPGNDTDVITVAPGATQHIRFAAGTPGTYLYWARTPDGQHGNFRVVDSQLGGALVVDPPGAPTNDRIFVLERWNGPMRTAINGKSWPYTERLNYEVGERVHWRLVNASDLSHPMHLHGFHFELDAEGDGEHYKTYEPGAQPQEFTHSVEIMETFDMTWVPTEPGRWLYHCHRIPHMRLPVPSPWRACDRGRGFRPRLGIRRYGRHDHGHHGHGPLRHRYDDQLEARAQAGACGRRTERRCAVLRAVAARPEPGRQSETSDEHGAHRSRDCADAETASRNICRQ